MNSAELIKKLSLGRDLSQSEIKRLLKKITRIFKEVLDEGRGFTIPGFGTFQTHVRKDRKSYNPFLRKLMIIPKKRVVAFHASSKLKEKLKKINE